jgi:hypothetical protein
MEHMESEFNIFTYAWQNEKNKETNYEVLESAL